MCSSIYCIQYTPYTTMIALNVYIEVLFVYFFLKRLPRSWRPRCGPSDHPTTPCRPRGQPSCEGRSSCGCDLSGERKCRFATTSCRQTRPPCGGASSGPSGRPPRGRQLAAGSSVLVGSLVGRTVGRSVGWSVRWLVTTVRVKILRWPCVTYADQFNVKNPVTTRTYTYDSIIIAV